ncbi:MAG: LysM domain-containing protein [Chloroflexota bacterium]
MIITLRDRIPPMNRFLAAVCILLVACTPQATELAPSNELTTYQTATPASTSTPGLIIIVHTAPPSPTPVSYTVQSGDTLSHIAEKFHVSLDALRAANPEVSPSSLPVGTVLLIPGESTGLSSASTPTPVPVPVTQTVCHPTADRGMACFALIRNDSQAALENVSARFTLIDSEGEVIASDMGLTPLNLLPTNSALPAYVFFPPEVPADARMQVQLLSAVSVSPNDTRYLPATLQNTSAQIDWDGHSAQVSGHVSLPAPTASKAATVVWVAAVVYDENGRVVGVKRWEGGEIQPGGSINFNFTVSSLGGEIDAVEFVVEARP